MEERWYLLFGGSSSDGMGPGKYEGRTVIAEKAREHFLKVKRSPYSTGYVIVVTDYKHERVMKVSDI